jgi:hypothetical protein
LWGDYQALEEVLALAVAEVLVPVVEAVEVAL